MTTMPPATWAAEMQVLQDQIQTLELDLECARRNENAATYWYGQDDGVRGTCLRWAEALTDPMPKAGTMREPLETLYRQTEALRRDLDDYAGLMVAHAQAVAELAFVRGQRDGAVSLLHFAREHLATGAPPDVAALLNRLEVALRSPSL
jgi:hypothetical protein